MLLLHLRFHQAKISAQHWSYGMLVKNEVKKEKKKDKDGKNVMKAEGSWEFQ